MVSSCYRRSSIFPASFPALLREAFSGRRPFLVLNSGNIHVFFLAMFFPCHRFYIQPLLLSGAAAFGNCCFWRLVILGEQKMVRLSSLPATWMGFSVLDPVIFHNSSWHKQYLPCCRVRFSRVQNTEKGLEKCSKHHLCVCLHFSFSCSQIHVVFYHTYYHTYLT